MHLFSTYENAETIVALELGILLFYLLCDYSLKTQSHFSVTCMYLSLLSQSK